MIEWEATRPPAVHELHDWDVTLATIDGKTTHATGFAIRTQWGKRCVAWLPLPAPYSKEPIG